MNDNVNYETNVKLASKALETANENGNLVIAVNIAPNNHTKSGLNYFTMDPRNDPEDFNSWVVFIGETNDTGNYTLQDCVDELKLH